MDLALQTSVLGVKTLHSTAEVPDNMTKGIGVRAGGCRCARSGETLTANRSGVHNAKAEECTTPHIGSRNIEINIGGGRLPRNQKIVTLVAIAAVCQPSSLQAHRSRSSQVFIRNGSR